jgi:hypothetical protein
VRLLPKFRKRCAIALGLGAAACASAPPLPYMAKVQHIPRPLTHAQIFTGVLTAENNCVVVRIETDQGSNVATAIFGPHAVLARSKDGSLLVKSADQTPVAFDMSIRFEADLIVIDPLEPPIDDLFLIDMLGASPPKNCPRSMMFFGQKSPKLAL